MVHSYNNTHHRSINTKPSHVTYANQKKVRDILYGDLNTEKKGLKKRKIYKLGDRVRISKTKHVFKKGYLPNWTEEVFTIVGRLNTQPPVYKISDYNGEMLEGTFYEEELQKIVKDDDALYIVEKVLRKRKRKGHMEYFVKWRGCDDSFNSWIRDLQRL
ncbi:uncharacterized protein LOC100370495 [Saccoglossus kowalevskii]|uniref:Uncharacterized protein LOC100370495 n=1 Tax=Saccoglossus kowalevskii TaxID=10224 RepID=A0ABM0LZ72_SACKO|nr:PREDICTED: uncharacterized protein LOC100370495 [Saccoglossus kowalevskii]